MMLDLQFLEAHPATVLWAAQRQECAECAHRQPNRGNGEMRCLKAPTVRGNKYTYGHGTPIDFCINARLADGPCGPAAVLWAKA